MRRALFTICPKGFASKSSVELLDLPEGGSFATRLLGKFHSISDAHRKAQRFGMAGFI